MDVSVITVTWNSSEYIIEQMQTVRSAAERASYEHIIVDNASEDKTIELVQRHFPVAYTIGNYVNRGFGYANNQGLRVAKGRYLLFLNLEETF